MRQINQAGLNLIKHCEGCRLTAYLDQKGIWTIGWGHTPALQGQNITQDQADTFLLTDLSWVESFIEKLVMIPLTDNQFSALCSFVFNIGGRNFQNSTLLEDLNNGNYEGAADELLRWDHAGAVVSEGLADRRKAERNLFLTPDSYA